MSVHSPSPESPWRRVLEELRQVIGNKRDADGVLGSINWLRQHMALEGANPNVVRNILYRDKGKPADKRVLYKLIRNLWQEQTGTALQAPELEVLFADTSISDADVSQLLGREKRRAYTSFVSSVRSGQQPKLLVLGRPGSGKTLLLDYIQQALELAPKAAQSIVRLEFSSPDVLSSLSLLADKLGVPRNVLEAKVVKLGTASAFAVQADAQADISRTLIEALRLRQRTCILLLHLSQTLNDTTLMAGTSLRLNTDEVPRVNAADWLWFNLIEPLSKLPDLSLLVSSVSIPARALGNLNTFDGPVKLSPPTLSEARRFVKTRLPSLPTAEQEVIVQRAGRSYEQLRTLALLAELREFSPDDGSSHFEHLEQLSQLLETTADARLRHFLEALAVLSLAEYPVFHAHSLAALLPAEWSQLNQIEQAFLDPVPGQDECYRCFSRQFARGLRQRFRLNNHERYQHLHQLAAEHYESADEILPTPEKTVRCLHHLFEARNWPKLESWMLRSSIPQNLLPRLWDCALVELSAAPLEAIARQVASHYVRLGSYQHPDAKASLAVLESSDNTATKAWTLLKRAEGAVLRGQIDQAGELLENWPDPGSRHLEVEFHLIQASIARWRGDLTKAAKLINQRARVLLGSISASDSDYRSLSARVAVWAGLIAKDQGDLQTALHEFSSLHPADDLISARLAFQIGDVHMQLGQFDSALSALSSAVHGAYRNEALIQEQTRYLARRGTLYRKQHQLSLSQADFDAALSLLQADSELEDLERAFWLAKVQDEYALLLLAQGHFDEAIFLLYHNQQVFQTYQEEHQLDASYRSLRSRLRLALAYVCRSSRQSYYYPIVRPVNSVTDSHDLRQAQHLIEQTLAAIAAKTQSDVLYQRLYRRALLLASSIVEAKDACDYAEQAISFSDYAYEAARSYGHLACAALQTSDYQLAQKATTHARLELEQLNQPSDQDPALTSWILSLSLQGSILAGDIPKALNLLAEALQMPHLATFHEMMLRTTAQLLEDSANLHHQLLADYNQATTGLRLADQLVLDWREGRLNLAPAELSQA